MADYFFYIKWQTIKWVLPIISSVILHKLRQIKKYLLIISSLKLLISISGKYNKNIIQIQ